VLTPAFALALSAPELCSPAMVKGGAHREEISFIEDMILQGAFVINWAAYERYKEVVSRGGTAEGWRSKYRTQTASHVASGRYSKRSSLM